MQSKYCILGYPLGHSLSPEFHKSIFKFEGIDAQYSVLEVPPENLEKNIPYLKSLNGFNVTIPHKENIIKYLDKLAPSAEIYGAVNTVVCGDECVGHNTDVDGFLYTMYCAGIQISGKIVVLGCGGVGRMFALCCARQGADVTIAVLPRNMQSAKDIVSNYALNIDVVNISLLAGGWDLMINATPVGMYPNIDLMPVTSKALEGTRAVFDCIYNPTRTVLMDTATQLGIKKVVGGMSMLMWQAIAAHEIWHNC